MHRHLHLVVSRPKPVQRPAKVISLDARREARVEEKRPHSPPRRPAA